jgi:pimeloyl-ACP methyl ester carboxylesterase
MSISSELHYPSHWYSKLAAVTIAVAFFLALFTGAVSFYLLYRIAHPVVTRIDINASDFPGHPQDFSFNLPGGSRVGWFFPGLRGAPTIVLCHGYSSSRGELLTLATSLQDRQYNVFLFDFSGHGDSPGLTTLGVTEPQELEAALNALARRDDVDSQRFGLWGANLGAYTALATAQHDPRVRAFALESVYETPDDFLRIQVRQSGLSQIPLIEDLTVAVFHREYPADRTIQPLALSMAAVAPDAKFFLEADDEPLLALETRELYMKTPDPKQAAELTSGNYAAMSDDAKRTYENRLLGFFLLNLPTTSRGGR